MNPQHLDSVREQAIDLRVKEPRSADDELGGFEGGLRALDKCRATLVGMNGEFQFNCPLDKRFFRATGIDSNQFKDYVATGASDEAVDRWVREHASSSAPAS